MKHKIIIKTTVFILITAMLCSCFTGCSRKSPAPEETIQTLEDSINELNLDKCLDCFSSNIRDTIRHLITEQDKNGGLSILKITTMAKSVLPFIPFLTNNTVSSEDLPKIDFAVQNSDVNDDTALLKLDCTVSWGKFSHSFDLDVSMKLEGKTWLISGIG